MKNSILLAVSRQELKPMGGNKKRDVYDCPHRRHYGGKKSKALLHPQMIDSLLIASDREASKI